MKHEVSDDFLLSDQLQVRTSPSWSKDIGWLHAEGHWVTAKSNWKLSVLATEVWSCGFWKLHTAEFNVKIPFQGLPWWLSGKERACQCRRLEFHPWSGKIPWRRKWQATQVLLPEKSHWQGSPEGYRPWQRVERDWTGAILQRVSSGTYLVVQWLTHLPMQGVWVQSLIEELRPHMPPVQKTKP